MGRYRETITRLNNLLDTERRKHRSTQKDLRKMIENRSEVESLLLECLNHVKTEVQRRRLDKINQYRERTKSRQGGIPPSSATASGLASDGVPVSELSATDREKVL